MRVHFLCAVVIILWGMFASSHRGVAAEARLFLSRRGPPTNGCLGPRVGEAPYIEIPGGGEVQLHLWMNVDGVPEGETFLEHGWGLEAIGAFAFLEESEISNPSNTRVGQPRWSSVFRDSAEYPYLVYRAGGFSIGSPSVGTTAIGRSDPGYDSATNSFYMGSATVDVGFGGTALFLRNGRLTALKSGEPINLLFGDSDIRHSGQTADAGDAIPGYINQDAAIAGTGRPNFFGIFPGSAQYYEPETIERRIDLASGRRNVAYCASGEWYGRIGVDNFHGEELEIYVDFAGVSGADVSERLAWILGDTGTEYITDVSGTDPLKNGIDYDVHVRFLQFTPAETFVLAFETQFDLPGLPIANIAVIPEPPSLVLAALGCLTGLARLTSHKRTKIPDRRKNPPRRKSRTTGS